MKLSEIKMIAETVSADEFTVSKWDGNEPDEGYIKPFDVIVTYKKEDFGHSDHPYGEGSAREQHGMSVFDVVIKTAESVILMDDDGNEVIKTFPIGTLISDIPGWETTSFSIFQDKAEEHANSN
jgi:hypothetical protein